MLASAPESKYLENNEKERPGCESESHLWSVQCVGVICIVLLLFV